MRPEHAAAIASQYEQWRASGDLMPIQPWPAWDELAPDMRHRFLYILEPLILQREAQGAAIMTQPLPPTSPLPHTTPPPCDCACTTEHPAAGAICARQQAVAMIGGVPVCGACRQAILDEALIRSWEATQRQD